MAEETKLELKLLVDKSRNIVIVAEADKIFVDFLFTLLALPVGTVVRLIEKKKNTGQISLGNLYQSVQDLNDFYLQPNKQKDSLLNPKLPASVAEVGFLLPYMETSSAKSFYRCGNSSSHNTQPYGNCPSMSISSSSLTNIPCRQYVSEDPKAICPACKGFMSQSAELVISQNDTKVATNSNDKGYVKELVTYMVMDDLVVKPMSGISSIVLLNNFNVKDLGCLEERVVKVGMDEAVKLLQASLQSKTVLTDVFLEAEDVKVT